jgi:CxxC motif-containing protein (DUF1111 family)
MVAAALVNELGVSSAHFPTDDVTPPHPAAARIEITGAELRALVAYIRELPPPRRPVLDEAATRGAQVFADVGCVSCHMPALRLDGLRAGVIRAYTDLALHDLGPALADVPEGQASARQFRTAPLWGVGARGAVYLHDGRAIALHDAILAHDGEAAATTARYQALPTDQRLRLLAFLHAL